MKCPKCNSEIGECKICPFCGYEKNNQNRNICKKCGNQGNIYFEGMCEKCYNETYADKNKRIENNNKDRTKFLFISKIIAIAVFAMGIIICLTIELYSVAIALIVTIIILCIIIQIFETIIDLLQEINSKL